MFTDRARAGRVAELADRIIQRDREHIADLLAGYPMLTRILLHTALTEGIVEGVRQERARARRRDEKK